MRRLALTTLAAAALAALPTAPPASAALLPPLPLEGAIGAVLDAAGAAACPISPDATADVACSLATLGYRIHTELARPGDHPRQPGPPLLRDQDALVQIPEPVDVDGDGRADLTVTLAASDLHTFSLRVQRRAGAPASLPVKLEALIDTPGRALAGRLAVAGYDARRSDAPQDWRATLTIPDQAEDATHLLLDVTTAGAPARLGVVGELATGHERRDPAGGTVTFQPVPSILQADLTLGTVSDDVRVRTADATTATIDAHVVRGDDRHDITGELAGLPATAPGVPSFTVHYDHPAEHEQHVVVDAAAALPLVTATYDHPASSADPERHATLVLQGVPRHLEAHQRSEDAGDVSTGGTGAVRTADVIFAQGMARQPIDAGVPASDHAVRVVKGEAGKAGAVALRVQGLASATVDGDATPHLDVTSTRLPLHAAFEDPGAQRTVTADVDDLPGHLVLDADPAGGVYHLDGHGQPIDHAHLVATSDGAPLFGRAKVADVTLDGIPASVVADILDGDQGKGARLSAAIGSIDALVTDGGATPPPLTLPNGLTLLDGPGAFALHAHASGLQEVRATDDPIALDVKASRPQPFAFDVRRPAQLGFGPAQRVSGHVDVPRDVHLAVTKVPGGPILDADGLTRFDYEASDPIHHLHLEGEHLPLAGGAQNVEIDAEDVPTELHGALDDDFCPPTADRPCGTELHVAAPDRIGRLLVEKLDPPALGDPAFVDQKPDADVLHLDALPGDRQSTVVQVHGLKSFALDHPGGDLATRVDVATPFPLDLSIRRQGAQDARPLIITGTIDRPQPDTTFRFDQGAALRVDLTGAGTIDRLALLVLKSDGGLVDMDLRDLPTDLHTCLDTDGGTCIPPDELFDNRVHAQLSLRTRASSHWTIKDLRVCTIAVLECDTTDEATLTELHDVVVRDLTFDEAAPSAEGRTYAFIDTFGEPFAIGQALKSRPKGLNDNVSLAVRLENAAADRRYIRIRDFIGLPSSGTLACSGDALIVVKHFDLTDGACNA